VQYGDALPDMNARSGLPSPLKSAASQSTCAAGGFLTARADLGVDLTQAAGLHGNPAALSISIGGWQHTLDSSIARLYLRKLEQGSALSALIPLLKLLGLRHYRR
jgi:hypothetical protein